MDFSYLKSKTQNDGCIALNIPHLENVKSEK
jgi:hypothetical protein